jgi:hypothetical protein
LICELSKVNQVAVVQRLVPKHGVHFALKLGQLALQLVTGFLAEGLVVLHFAQLAAAVEALAGQLVLRSRQLLLKGVQHHRVSEEHLDQGALLGWDFLLVLRN